MWFCFFLCLSNVFNFISAYFHFTSNLESYFISELLAVNLIASFKYLKLILRFFTKFSEENITLTFY